MSPQTRRGRTAPVSHRKSSSRGAAAAAAAVKPAASTEPIEGQQVAEVKPATARHGRRKRDLGHVKKSSGYRYLTELFGAYTPLLIAFVVLFAGVWGWISFGPHPPTPQDSWSRIEKAWITKHEDAHTAVSNALGNATAQTAAYKDYRNVIKSWADDLSKVGSWDDPKKSAADNKTTANHMADFIQAANDEVSLIDQLASAQSPGDFSTLSNQIADDDNSWSTDYALVRYDIMGQAQFQATQPPLAVPTPTIPPCESPDPSLSPDPSASPVVCSTPAPSVSPGVSPAASTSPGPSLSPAPSLSPKPS